MSISSWPKPSWRLAAPAVVLLVILGWQLPGAEPDPQPVSQVKTKPKPKPRAEKPRRQVSAYRAPQVQAAAAISLPSLPSEPGPTRVDCAVGRSLEGRNYVVTVEDPEAPHGTGLRQGSYDGEVLELVLPEGSTRGMLIFPGTDEEAVPLSFSGGECRVDGQLPTAADAALYGVVRGAQGLEEGSVYLEGCGASDAPVDADGTFFVSTKPGPCLMRAWRRSGSLRVPSRWYEIDPVAGGDV